MIIAIGVVDARYCVVEVKEVPGPQLHQCMSDSDTDRSRENFADEPFTSGLACLRELGLALT